MVRRCQAGDVRSLLPVNISGTRECKFVNAAEQAVRRFCKAFLEYFRTSIASRCFPENASRSAMPSSQQKSSLCRIGAVEERGALACPCSA